MYSLLPDIQNVFKRSSFLTRTEYVRTDSSWLEICKSSVKALTVHKQSEYYKLYDSVRKSLEDSLAEGILKIYAYQQKRNMGRENSRYFCQGKKHPRLLYISSKPSMKVATTCFVMSLLTSAPAFADLDIDRSNKIMSIPANSHKFQPKPLPPEPAQDHEANRVLDLGPLRQSMTIPISSTTKPIRLEASYNEPLGLEEALRHALKYSLPIRIAKESWVYQRWQLFNEITDYLPSFAMGWNLTNSQIDPDLTASNARVFSVSERFPLFAGGNALYGIITQYYRERGWKQSYCTSINDALLDVYRAYNNLRLNNALLQIRAKSLEVSESQLKVNNALYTAGTGTQFAIMQSRTQLGADQQLLLAQQVATRQAAIVLAYSLNIPLSINLIPRDQVLKEDSIIDERIGVDDLMGLTLAHRPELRQYELFQLGAARNVQLAASTLYPTAGAFTTYTHSSTTTYQSTKTKNNIYTQDAMAYNIQQLQNQAAAVNQVQRIAHFRAPQVRQPAALLVLRIHQVVPAPVRLRVARPRVLQARVHRHPVLRRTRAQLPTQESLEVSTIQLKLATPWDGPCLTWAQERCSTYFQHEPFRDRQCFRPIRSCCLSINKYAMPI
jgi:outer membrane protein TolC